MKLFKLSSFVFLAFLVINSNVFCVQRCFKIKNSTKEVIIRSWWVNFNDESTHFSGDAEFVPVGKTLEFCSNNKIQLNPVKFWVSRFYCDGMSSSCVKEDFSTGDVKFKEFFTGCDKTKEALNYGFEFYKDDVSGKYKIKKLLSENDDSQYVEEE